MLRRIISLLFLVTALSALSENTQARKIRSSSPMMSLPERIRSGNNKEFRLQQPKISTNAIEKVTSTPSSQETKLPLLSSPGPLAVMQTVSFLLVFSMSTISLSPAPALIKELGAEKATSLLSIMTAAAAATQIVLSPLTGSILDSVGRRSPMIGLSASVALASALTAVRPSVWTICLAKVVGMLATSQYVVATQAVLGDVTASDPNRLGAIMGKQYALVSLGFLAGGFAAGRLSDFGLAIPYGISTTLSALATLVVLLKMPETLPPMKKVPLNKDSRTLERILEAPLSCIHLLARHGSEMRWLAILLMIQSGPMYMGDFVQVFAAKEWNLGAKGFSNIIVLWGLSGIAANVVATFLVERLGLRKFTAVATLSALCFPIGACFSFKAAIIGGCAGFLGASQMLATTAALTTQGQKTGVPHGVLAGERASLMALLKVIGPIWYSALYLWGQRSGLPHLPFLFNVVLSAAALVIGLRCLS